jgi:peptide/nickel transport system substrate-binding protein
LAIDQAVDKDKIIEEVLAGYGVAIDDPIPPNMLAYQKLANVDNLSHDASLQEAETTLAKDGWVKGADGFLQKTTATKGKGKNAKTTKTSAELSFSISTSNTGELAKTAELVQEDLEAIGMKVDIKTFEIGNLNQSVIRPRKYDALLFGEIINQESDLFAFWHSSQRKDPGLNVALYTNAKVDKILEQAFITTDEATRTKEYTQFEQEIRQDMPAVFLYSPDFIYVVSNNLKGMTVNNLVSPADRFGNVYQWYVDTDNVWKIFTK